MTKVIDTESRTQIIAHFAQHAGDTGSTEVQVALLTHRINELNLHLKTHAKDFASRRGLLQLVNQRRKLLKYVKAHNIKRYETLLTRLELRK